MPVLEADTVSFAYGDEPVLDRVSLRVLSGEFAALVGPNGAGKSTLMRVLLGLLAPQSGSVRLFDGAPAELRDRGRIGYVPQRTVVPVDLPATVSEVVSAGRLGRRAWWRGPTVADRTAVDHAIDSVGLADLRRRPFTDLSGGQQQRVLIAKAFASEPELLILDEPIAGVDVDAQQQFRDALVHLLREHGAAVLLVSHELGAVADDLDHLIVLKHRVLFDGRPGDLQERGVNLGVHRHDLPLWLEDLG